MVVSSFKHAGFSESAIEELCGKISSVLAEYELSSFLLGCSFPKELSDDEVALLKREFQFSLTKALEEKLSVPYKSEKAGAEITVDFNAGSIKAFIRSVYLLGRYNKFSRNIAQTIFYCPKCKGLGCRECNLEGTLGLETVQELIAGPALKAFSANDNKFHGQGREDVDVRMLGRGRAFVLELLEPKKRKADLKKLEKEINSSARGKIEVHSLEFCEKEKVAELKESKARKLYLATVECAAAINEDKLLALKEKCIDVKQRTPHRVSKRRSDLVRERNAKIVSINPLSKKRFLIEIDAEAGLYIKEFISGDAGRSVPSVSSLLGVECSCIELDVLEILD